MRTILSHILHSFFCSTLPSPALGPDKAVGSLLSGSSLQNPLCLLLPSPWGASALCVFCLLHQMLSPKFSATREADRLYPEAVIGSQHPQVPVTRIGKTDS